MSSPFLYIVICSGLFCLNALWFFVKLIRHRRWIRNYPVPPHSFWWGHLKLVGDIRKEIPSDTWPLGCWMVIAKRYGLGDIWVLDLWPIVNPILVVSDPEIAARFTQTISLPKAPFQRPFLGTLLGEQSILFAEGMEWRALRGMFNPGFSSSHIMSLMPSLSYHIETFRKKLLDFAKSGEIVHLQEHATLMSIDVIGKVVLDVNLGAQLGYSPIAHHFCSAVAATKPHVDWWSRLRHAIPLRWHLYQVHRYLGEVIRERYLSYSGQKSKVALDLALQSYNEDMLVKDSSRSRELDKRFFKIALDNVKTIFVAGHETTGSVVSYAYYFLADHPDILENVRAEHDRVFGKDATSTIQVLRENPSKLNQLPLTNAVIKETLRLRPPGMSFRAAPEGTYLDWKGLRFPAWNLDIAIFHYGVHHHPSWTDPDTFRPNRFLPPDEPPKDGWRPFEKGPRQCLGQELAMLEIRAVLLLTLRDLDFEPAYEKDDPAIEGFGGQACEWNNPFVGDGTDINPSLRSDDATFYETSKDDADAGEVEALLRR